MPRKSDRKLFLEAYEHEIENELADLDDELEIEVDCMSIDSEISSDSSLSSLSLNSLSSTSSSSSSSSSLDSVQQTPVQRQATPVVLCSLLFLQESKAILFSYFWHYWTPTRGPRISTTSRWSLWNGLVQRGVRPVDSVTAIARHFACGAGAWDGTAVYKASGDSFDEPLEGSCLMDFETIEEVNAG